MASLQEIVDAFDNYVESAGGLEINCIKGYPDFRQPAITTPLAALFYGGSGTGEGQVQKRVGGGITATVLTLGVYAGNEVQLFSLAAKLQTMRRAGPLALTAGSDNQPVKAYIGEDEREPPDADAEKELRHFITCPVVLAFE